MMNTALPVVQPYSQTVYSSLSFILFGLALGNHANKTYEQLLDEAITRPLGLQNTGVSPGDSEKAVIAPLGHQYQGWGTEYGLNAP